MDRNKEATAKLLVRLMSNGATSHLLLGKEVAKRDYLKSFWQYPRYYYQQTVKFFYDNIFQETSPVEKEITTIQNCQTAIKKFYKKNISPDTIKTLFGAVADLNPYHDNLSHLLQHKLKCIKLDLIALCNKNMRSNLAFDELLINDDQLIKNIQQELSNYLRKRGELGRLTLQLRTRLNSFNGKTVLKKRIKILKIICQLHKNEHIPISLKQKLADLKIAVTHALPRKDAKQTINDHDSNKNDNSALLKAVELLEPEELSPAWKTGLGYCISLANTCGAERLANWLTAIKDKQTPRNIPLKKIKSIQVVAGLQATSLKSELKQYPTKLTLEEKHELYQQLCDAINDYKCSKELIVELEKAKLSILRDISWQISPIPTKRKKEEKKRSPLTIAIFAVAATLGTVFFGAEAVDAIGSIFELIREFNYVPNGVVGTVIFVFSSLAIFSGWAFKLKYVADSLGVSIFNAASIIHTYQKQMNELNTCYEKLNKAIEHVTNDTELNEIKKQFEYLKRIEKEVINTQYKLKDAKESSSANTFVKYAVTVSTAILIMGEAFFVGASSTLVILGLCGYIATMASLFTIPPVGIALTLGIGIILAIGALSLYCLTESDAMGKAIDSLFGKPHQAAVDFICDETYKKNAELLNAKIVNKVQTSTHTSKSDPAAKLKTQIKNLGLMTKELLIVEKTKRTYTTIWQYPRYYYQKSINTIYRKFWGEPSPAEIELSAINTCSTAITFFENSTKTQNDIKNLYAKITSLNPFRDNLSHQLQYKLKSIKQHLLALTDDDKKSGLVLSEMFINHESLINNLQQALSPYLRSNQAIRYLNTQLQSTSVDPESALRTIGKIQRQKKCPQELKHNLAELKLSLIDTLPRKKAEAILREPENYTFENDNSSLTEAAKLLQSEDKNNTLINELTQDLSSLSPVEKKILYQNTSKAIDEHHYSNALILALEEAKITLLREISWQISPIPMKKKQEEKKATWLIKSLFGFVASLATFHFISEAIDGINSIIDIIRKFNYVPAGVSASVLLVFGALAAFSGWAFELKYVADELGISIFNVASVIKSYQEQLNELNACYEKLLEEIKTVQDKEALKQINEQFDTLQAIQKNLVDKQHMIKDGNKLFSANTIVKYTVIASTAILVAATGFFVGASSTLMVLGLCGFTATLATLATLPPFGIPLVLTFGITMAIGALLIYAFSDGNAMGKAIDSLFGKPHEAAEAFMEDNAHEKNAELLSVKIANKQQQFELANKEAKGKTVASIEYTNDTLQPKPGPEKVIARENDAVEDWKNQNQDNIIPLGDNTYSNWNTQNHDDGSDDEIELPVRNVKIITG